jgi:hypothetical protein
MDCALIMDNLCLLFESKLWRLSRIPKKHVGTKNQKWNHGPTWWKEVEEHRHLIEVVDSTKAVDFEDEKEIPSNTNSMEESCNIAKV